MHPDHMLGALNMKEEEESILAIIVLLIYVFVLELLKEELN